MKCEKVISLIWKMLNIAMVLGVYLCFVSLCTSCNANEDNDAWQSSRSHVMLAVEECFREEHCGRQTSREESGTCTSCAFASSEHFLLLTTLAKFVRSSQPIHAWLIYFLKHLPVRAGPFC